MEPEARYAWVGAAVLALVALLVGGMVWLTGGTEDKVVKHYTVYFEKQSLEGLQIGSGVRMQGISVGKVEDYAIIPGQARRVRVQIQVDARTPVLEGVVAEVARHLVTGLAAIDLVNLAEGGAPLMNVPDGEDYPVIPEGESQLARVASTLEDMGTEGRVVLGRINTLLSDDNLKAFSRTLTHLDVLGGDLRKAVPDLNAALEGTRVAAQRVTDLSEATDKVVSAGQARLVVLADDTQATLGQARQTLSTLNQEMDGLGVRLKVSADLATQDIQSTAQALRQAGESLQETGQAFSDPVRLLYGSHEASLGPGENP